MTRVQTGRETTRRGSPATRRHRIVKMFAAGPFVSAAGAAWLAILIASVRSPVFTESRVEWKKTIRHPLVYLGLVREKNVPLKTTTAAKVK